MSSIANAKATQLSDQLGSKVNNADLKLKLEMMKKATAMTT